MSVQSATTSTFQAEVLQSDIPVLVDFWAPWCPPCRAVAPILDTLAQENSGKIKVVKINVDDNPQLAQQYSVSSIPAFRIFDNGQSAGSFVGAMSKESFEARLSAFLGD
ncbi:thioredoxin [Arthrobacter sp. JUb115]|uniref:thioredoxin n=1 Tax=Arthrobacter sp. JUb115 TaxID=2485108 RepID=UPI001060478A|nr:thioredoxin [Arthrobacter sp. JUb115]